MYASSDMVEIFLFPLKSLSMWPNIDSENLLWVGTDLVLAFTFAENLYYFPFITSTNSYFKVLIIAGNTDSNIMMTFESCDRGSIKHC